MTDGRTDWVALSPRFTSGWPWPEDSFGLGPMYGDTGWCRSCGAALVPQCGDLVVQGNKFPGAEVWMPNWRFDVFCVSARVAAEIQQRFIVSLSDVLTPRKGATGVKQMLPCVTKRPWHDPEDVGRAVVARHGDDYADQAGTACAGCTRWRWLPVTAFETPIMAGALADQGDVIASPEIFGSGLSSFRHVLFRRELGQLLFDASPRNWRLAEVEVVHG